MQERFPSLIDPPIGFAHRGARAHGPENTLETFSLALRLGATGLESDVWLTSDGVAVLDHDGLVKIGLRRRPIIDVAHGNLPSHIPTLEQLFMTCGHDFDLSLDLKDDAAAEAVIDIARSAYQGSTERLWICHPNWEVVAGFRRYDEGVRLVDSTRLAKMKEGPERRAATLASRGVNAVNLHHADWTAGLIALFHRFDVATMAWDLQFDHLLHNVLRMGIDAVFSDWVDRMTDAVATYR